MIGATVIQQCDDDRHDSLERRCSDDESPLVYARESTTGEDGNTQTRTYFSFNFKNFMNPFGYIVLGVLSFGYIMEACGSPEKESSSIEQTEYKRASLTIYKQ